MKQRQVIIDTERCVGCGLCSRVCVAGNIAISGQKAGTIGESCIFCGQCSAVCPQKAISMVGCGDGQVEKEGDVCLCPDDVLDAIRFRRSVRTFQQREIPREVLAQILEAGRLTHRTSPSPSSTGKKTAWRGWRSGCSGRCGRSRAGLARWRGTAGSTSTFSSFARQLSSSSWPTIRRMASSPRRIWSSSRRQTAWACCTAAFLPWPPALRER